MELIVEYEGVWVAALQKFSLDLAQGADENNLALSYDGEIESGSFVFVPGTSYGGIVDGVEVDSGDGVHDLTYHGRSWEGVLQSSIIQPPAGQDYYIVSGDLYAVLRRIIERQGLAYAFNAPDGSYGLSVSYQFDRYVDCYTGICKMLATVNLVPRFEKSDGLCTISAERPVVYSQDGFDDYRFKIKLKDVRSPNHMICLGSGELQQRLVRHLYMDTEGNVSTTQTQFGIDEWQDKYDFPSAKDEQELLEGGAERLRELREQAQSCSVDVADSFKYKIGDIVTAVSAVAGKEVTTPITKTILTMDEISFEVAYEVGAITSKAR